ncbi:hypothetical protein FPOA_00862 [Fusarium poae]|uniref:Uncharacterized protein n=1 Tax=Fusarium poae TaxID=36050 RepID=A0A1B8B2I0_FUSPO|nr:hypothetical protein FPOA_00862 [Fusarium poae]
METAASIIAFVQITAEVVKCMVKAKQIWDQSKDLPKEIRDLIGRVQHYKTIFENMHDQVSNDTDEFSLKSNDSLVVNSLVILNQAHQALESFVNDLGAQLERKKGLKRRLLAIKMSMGRDTIERLKTGLSDALELLDASERAYNMAFTRRAPDYIIRRITNELPACFAAAQLAAQSTPKAIQDVQYDVKDADEKSSTRSQLSVTNATVSAPKRPKTFAPSMAGRFSLSYATTTGAWQAYVQFPSWISQSVLELQSNPTSWSSNYSFRVYNIVSFDSAIVQSVRNGDKKGVMELFNSRQASPFDKDQYGSSLLYHAVYTGNYEMCRFLLNAGLQESLEETVGREKDSPLSALVYQSEKKHSQKPEDAWEKITELFNSYLDDPESTMILRLFDFIQEWAYGDEYVLVFQRRFLKKFYTGPIENRLEAFRLGSFHLKTPEALLNILSQNKQVTTLDVELSSNRGLSLVHSAAIALGIRFADEVIPYKRAWCQWRVYTDGWSDVVSTVASAATLEDLHHLETVNPWNVHHVPSWRGTPLVSVLGGALCYVSPDISLFHWDAVFQRTLGQWVAGLKEAGVDLLEYGRREAVILKEQMRGAFDADAIESSWHQIRNPMAVSAETSRVISCKDGGWNKTHWIPIRLLDLEFGSEPQEWRVTWAPEFEWMAFQFWELVGREEHTLPGSWID